MPRVTAAIRRRRFVRGLTAMCSSLPFLADAAGPSSAGPVPPANDNGISVDVWVVLSLPELASLPRDQLAEREAQRQRIVTQQDQVMGRLRELGAVELARVQQVRNALAVRLPLAQLPAARTLPGVRSVAAVRHIDRRPPIAPAT